MADGLWWLPSLLVFGGAAVAFVAAIVGVRRLGRRRELADLEGGRAAEVRAKQLIVETDERVREARREIAFAEAQFGAEAARPMREASERAERWLREAFLLQQRLDDAEPDTAAERRSWSERIAGLCTSALGALDQAEQALGARRAAERGAGATLAELPETAARLGRRRADAAAALDRLGTRFRPTALVGGRAALDRVDLALAAAGAALAATGQAAGAGDAERAARIAADLDRAAADLDAIDRLELELAGAERAAEQGMRRLDAELVDARRQRDALSEPEDARVLGEAIAGVAELMGGAAAAPAAAELPDPFAERDRLDAALDRLEAARAEARTAQARLDGARSALGGALAIAESQLGVARALVERGRGLVGAGARTRLAEAERQLVIARQEPDPVAALDAARRAAARAADAEALASWDAGAGRR
ncbi:hypothetical protein [Agromyces sp. NBRC 114283]|uniref:hypothetical protein n=1 Tax=Agromyces sp. NBRC 114283 TaxID=2994521 RepID=UPI0024A44D9F|nr:hypothetical protein [Agromyces sp. NBRC 114283]GLU89063.1 hypothetical protein Agsp01_13180 [Agromyces sp. NBRC 114283]